MRAWPCRPPAPAKTPDTNCAFRGASSPKHGQVRSARTSHRTREGCSPTPTGVPGKASWEPAQGGDARRNRGGRWRKRGARAARSPRGVPGIAPAARTRDDARHQPGSPLGLRSPPLSGLRCWGPIASRRRILLQLPVTCRVASPPPAAFPVGRARRGAEAVPRGSPAPPHHSPCAPPPHQKRRRGFLWGVAGRLSRPFLRAPGRGGPARRRLPRRVHPAGRSSPRAPSPSPSGLGNGLQVGREDDAFFGHQIPRW